MKAYHGDTHFIHEFIHKLPSGRPQTYKHRCAIGKSCFLRHFILTVRPVNIFLNRAITYFFYSLILFIFTLF